MILTSKTDYLRATSFYRLAYGNPEYWKLLKNKKITHKILGDGIIQDADNDHIKIFFKDSKPEFRLFVSTAITNPTSFCYIQIPEEVEQLIADDISQRSKQSKDVQKVDIQKQEFIALKEKYMLQSYEEDSPICELFSILKAIEFKRQLSDDNIHWLEKENKVCLFRLLGSYFQIRFNKTRDPWDLIRSSSYWRKANSPARALTLTQDIIKPINPVDPKIRAAALTTRGGSFRDLKQFSKAENHAWEAIEVYESYQPYNLLGAIFFERGNPEKGLQYFQKAVELGLSPQIQENEIKNIVVKSDTSIKKVIIDYLKTTNLYTWIKDFL